MSLQPNFVKEFVPNYSSGKADCNEMLLIIPSTLDMSSLTYWRVGQFKGAQSMRRKNIPKFVIAVQWTRSGRSNFLTKICSPTVVRKLEGGAEVWPFPEGFISGASGWYSAQIEVPCRSPLWRSSGTFSSLWCSKLTRQVEVPHLARGQGNKREDSQVFWSLSSYLVVEAMAQKGLWAFHRKYAGKYKESATCNANSFS